MKYTLKILLMLTMGLCAALSPLACEPNIVTLDFPGEGGGDAGPDACPDGGDDAGMDCDPAADASMP